MPMAMPAQDFRGEQKRERCSRQREKPRMRIVHPCAVPPTEPRLPPRWVTSARLRSWGTSAGLSSHESASWTFRGFGSHLCCGHSTHSGPECRHVHPVFPGLSLGLQSSSGAIPHGRPHLSLSLYIFLPLVCPSLKVSPPPVWQCSLDLRIVSLIGGGESICLRQSHPHTDVPMSTST